MSGLFTTAIGYSHGKELGAAAAAQMEQLAYYPNWAATNPATLALTERILGARAAADVAHLLHLGRLGVGRVGLEAGPPALPGARRELAPHRHLAQRLLPRLLARRALDHRHAGARAPSSRSLGDTRHVMNTDPRQNPGGDPLAAADAIEEAILAAGPENVCMVIVEPVQNAGGTLVPPPGYAQRVREICDRHGVLLACDEVICAFGRLGHWFGSTRLGFKPDLITFAKAVTSGYAPLGGVIFTRASRRAAARGRGPLLARLHVRRPSRLCAMALANLAIMERLDVHANVLEVEPYLESVLNDVAAASPIVVEARGCGFFRSFEFTDAALVDRVRAATRDRGVIMRTDVRANPCLAISPPLICDRSHVDEIAEALAGGLAEIAG